MSFGCYAYKLQTLFTSSTIPTPTTLVIFSACKHLIMISFLDNHEVSTEVSTEDIDYMPMPPESSLFIFSTTNMWVEEFCCNLSPDIRHFGSKKRTRTESCPAIVSGIVSGGAPLSYCPVFYRPRNLCENQLGPISSSFQKFWILTWSQGTEGNR